MRYPMLRGMLSAALVLFSMVGIVHVMVITGHAWRAPHYENVCTASYQETELVLMPTLDASSNMTLIPLPQTKDICTASYIACVERGVKIPIKRCKERIQ